MEMDINEHIDKLGKTNDHDILSLWKKVAEELKIKNNVGTELLIDVMRDAECLSLGDIYPNFGGGWEWNLSEGIPKSIIVCGFTAAVLASCGVTPLIPAVVPSIIPFLFDLKRIKLEKDADRVIKIFGARLEVFDRSGSAEILYKSLPFQIQNSFAFDEFETFLQSAVEAGRAIDNESWFTILPNGDTVLKLKIT